ncbi:hypothetical protein DBR06_SOUSAS12610002, partial [Sousa chinensis]
GLRYFAEHDGNYARTASDHIPAIRDLPERHTCSGGDDRRLWRLKPRLTAVELHTVATGGGCEIITGLRTVSPQDPWFCIHGFKQAGILYDVYDPRLVKSAECRALSASAFLWLRRSFPLLLLADRQQRRRCSDFRRSPGAVSGQGHKEQSSLDLPQSPTFTITRMKKLLTLLSKVL